MTRRALALLVILTACATASAQDRWQHHIRTGEYAVAVGDLDRAEQEFSEALALVEAAGADSRRLETSLEHLAKLAEYRSRFDRAATLYERLLTARSARLGAASHALLEPLEAQSRVLAHVGNHEAAEAHMVRFLAIAETSARADASLEEAVLERLSRIYVKRSDTESALPLQRRLVDLARAHRADEPLELSTRLEGLAHLELMHGSAEQAEQLALETARLRTAAGDRAGAVQGLGTTATTAVAFAEPELGDRLARRALDEAAAAGLEGEITIAAHQALAEAAWFQVRRGSDRLVTLLEAGGDPAALAVAEERLLRLHELQASADPATLAETGRRLARVEAMQGDAAGALRWLRRAEGHTATLGLSDDQALGDLQDLVDLELAAGDSTAAAASNARLIETLEATRGPAHADLLEPLERQYELLRDLGRKKEAKTLKKRLKSLQKSLR